MSASGRGTITSGHPAAAKFVIAIRRNRVRGGTSSGSEGRSAPHDLLVVPIGLGSKKLRVVNWQFVQQTGTP